MAQSWIIRQAERKDCEEILRLIMGLAEYEKMPERVNMTVETLERDGFGATKYFHCFVAELLDEKGEGTGELACYTVFFHKYVTYQGLTLHMEDLYVTPGWRGKGIGTTLWKCVAKHALEHDCKRLEWSVLDWNKPSVELYKRRGAEDLTTKEGWLSFRMTHDVMQEFIKD